MIKEYEYEGKSNISFSIGNKLHFWNVTDDNLREELQEVYAKAKAFDKIRNVDKDFYKEYGNYPNEEEWWYDAINIIEKYEELHGGEIK